MSDFVPVTDEVLERARTDVHYREKLVSAYLDRLVKAMNEAKRKIKDGDSPQLKEGAQLAVKLADILHAIGGKPSR